MRRLAWRNKQPSRGVTISDMRAVTRARILVGLGVVVMLAAASPAKAALAFRFNRASAHPGQYVIAFEGGWRSVPTGVVVYLVPTRLPGVTPDAAGSYILPKPPAHHTIRLGRPRLAQSHRLFVRFRVPHVVPGNYTTAFWCLSCAKHGDFFASALWGAPWTGARDGVLRIMR
jgi:hypothetical protein